MLELDFQRVHAKNIQSISQSIDTVVEKLNNFIREVADHSSSNLKGVNHALVQIKKLVVNDISLMESTVNKYKQTYDHLLGANIDHLLHFPDSADYNIDYLVLRSATWPPNYSPYGKNPAAKKGIMGYGGNAFAQAMGVFDVLRLSLVSVKDIDTIMSSTDLDDTLREALPSSLWSSSERWETCTDLFEREGYEYESLVKLLYDVLDNFQKSDVKKGGQTVWKKS